MNDVLFQLQGNNPRLAFQALTMIGSMTQANPEAFLRDMPNVGLLNSDSVYVLTQNGFRPACVVCRDPFAGNIILLSGTQGSLHLSELIAGWQNPEGSNRANGANPAFQHAVENILGDLPANAINHSLPTRIWGYSYGGAVAQVMGDEFANNLRDQFVSVMTFASPRPGNSRFQQRMARVQNWRWFGDNDPVRFMPPHVPEVPSMLHFISPSLFNGMDTQVQCPHGLQIEEDGHIAVTEGNPTRTHAVLTSIVNWCLDIEGFQSVNHARETYLHRLSLAIQNEQVPVAAGADIRPDEPDTLSSGQTGYWSEQGLQDIVADPQITVAPGETINIVRTDRANPLRYRRRRRGRLWVVEYNGDVVAVGPGKRRAGQLARSFNRAALTN